MKYRIEQIETYNEKNVLIKTEYVIFKKHWLGWKIVKLPQIINPMPWEKGGLYSDKPLRGFCDKIKTHYDLSEQANNVVQRLLHFQNIYYIRNKDGSLNSCLWNGIVYEEIVKLKQLLSDEDYIEVHNLKCIENCYDNI